MHTIARTLPPGVVGEGGSYFSGNNGWDECYR